MVFKKFVAVVSCLLLFGRNCFCFFDINEVEPTSFSSAIKAFFYAEIGKEVTLYESSFDRPGFITEQWFTASNNLPNPFDHDSRIRIYVDYEEEASIDYNVAQAHAVPPDAFEEGKLPRGNRMFGRLAQGGGFYNTFKIPFKKGIKVTVTNNVRTGYIWYIIRGMIGTPLTVGVFKLPNDTRLRLYKKSEVVPALQFMDLARTKGKAGMLFLVTFDVRCATDVFMEGCMRANIDDEKVTFLSSGTEDFFLSAYYFNQGSYNGFQSGLIRKQTQGMQEIVAYKFFIDDPIVFRNYFRLFWRNWETANGKYGCPNTFPPIDQSEASKPVEFLKSANGAVIEGETAWAETYTWIYEWDAK